MTETVITERILTDTVTMESNTAALPEVVKIKFYTIILTTWRMRSLMYIIC